jgi:hypothetical protein
VHSPCCLYLTWCMYVCISEIWTDKGAKSRLLNEVINTYSVICTINRELIHL